MDIQTKISVYIKNGYHLSNEDIIFKKGESLNSPIFTFKEFSSVKLKLCSGNSRIRVETAMGTKELTEENEECMLSDFNNKLLLVPGVYKLILFNNKRKYQYLYEVKPNTVSEEDLLNIKECLEEVQHDLSRNLFSKMRLSGGENSISNSSFNKYNFIMENKELLFINLQSISNNPMSTLTKKYSRYKVTKKPDYRTYKDYSKRGENPHFPHNCISHYESKIENCYDIPENRWLYQFVGRSVYQIKLLENEIILRENRVKDKINELEEDFKRNSIRLKNSQNNTFVSRLTKENSSISVEVSQKEIAEHTDMKNVLYNMRKEIIPVVQQLNQIINCQFLTELSLKNRPMKYSTRIMKDRRYSWINKFDEQLNSYISHKNENTDLYYENKATYELFEYYSVIIIIEILHELGFNWTDGWLANNCSFNEELFKGTRLVFERDDEKIFLDYDREIKYASNEIEKDFFSINSKNRRPDILVSYYKADKIKGAIVFEVKYRKSQYLYNTNGDTNVVEQMKNYFQIAYYDESIERDVIKKVVTLYPYQEKLVNYKEPMFKDTLFFLEVKPRKSIKEIDSYKVIKGHLYHLLTL
jgi:hypothetical protein